jgi:peptidyl-prolyl cis-trans isomerase A (cyclophilin A)
MIGLLAILAGTALAHTEIATAQQSNSALEQGLYATINTSMGPITVKFFEEEAPITVRNFRALATGAKVWRDPGTGQMVRRPLYPGTIFHRLIPGFMIQGGDPAGDGTGDVGFVILDEFVPALTFDVPGRLAMANAGPHTGGSQFFITDAPAPHLNGKHTIFGQVIEGQDVVTRIAYAPRNGDDRPLTPVEIVSISFKREGPPPTPLHAAPSEPALAPIEPPPPPPADPTEIAEGQTIDEVAAALGQPLKKAKVGNKEIYYYKDLKVSFVNGKVKDVQ